MSKFFQVWIVWSKVRDDGHDDCHICTTVNAVTQAVEQLHDSLTSDGYDFSSDDIHVNEVGKACKFKLIRPKTQVEFIG